MQHYPYSQGLGDTTEWGSEFLEPKELVTPRHDKESAPMTSQHCGWLYDQDNDYSLHDSVERGNSTGLTLTQRAAGG